MIKKEKVIPFIKNALEEDIREGDHSSIACIPNNKVGRAKLLIKENGIIVCPIIRDNRQVIIKYKRKNNKLISQEFDDVLFVPNLKGIN